MTQVELMHVTGVHNTTISGYEKTKGASRIPQPDFVFKLLDQVARYTTEDEINERGMSDTLDMYSKLLRLSANVSPRAYGSFYRNLLKALEAEKELRAARHEITSKEATQASLLQLREEGTDVTDAALAQVSAEIEQARALLPDLIEAAKETAAAIHRTPVPPHEQEPRIEREPTEPLLQHKSEDVLGPLQKSLPPGTMPHGSRASGRFVIVGVLAAIVVIALGMTLIIRLTGDSNSSSQASGPSSGRPAPAATPTVSHSSPSPKPKKSRAPKTTPPKSSSPTPTLLDQTPFEYEKASDIYIGSRGTDFDTKPPLDGLKTESYSDLNTLRMEGRGVVLQRTLDAQKLVKTRPGFTASYASCTQLMDQSLGNQNIAAQTGDSFCFDTNQHRVVFMTIKKALPAVVDRDNRVIVDVTVWEDPKSVQTDLG
ncbi:hypothetical protein [Streptomyces sp. NBC_00687]|uniref:hypothetical protein n=1 Tax=Streptomyces sp. NBC_00687 TaxID=2975807 RepID=UPI00224E7CC2|nr:hypothetical protein [Streptomyces sp. NBC_00687]MCX4920306.1 hypothetical protein [Streptomyces sp. NBC_00687]